MAPSRDRVTVFREAGRLVVSMRGERSLGAAAVLAVWLAGWAAGEVAVAQRLFFSEEPEAGAAFMALWLALWTLGGLLAFRALLGAIGGSEVAAIDGPSLTLRRRPIGRRRVYPLAQVRNLRAEATARRQASLAFEVDGRTVRFGARLDPADAERVLAALGTRVALGPSRPPPEPPAPEPEPWEHGGG
jgi:hypothetical protein